MWGAAIRPLPIPDTIPDDMPDDGGAALRIGFNFTLGATAPMVRRLIAAGRIDYVELLVDNFLAVPPAQIAAAFDAPVGLHIMFSKFMERPEAELDELALRLTAIIRETRPIYVSDHIARFTHQGRHLLHLAEIDYAGEFERVADRVARWQDRLGCTIAFENYPSIMDGGRDAPDFFRRLTARTGCTVLFDVSNAVCATHNCGLPFEAWTEVIRSARQFHVAGYDHSVGQPPIVLDTHDRALAADTRAALALCRALVTDPEATITYERDDDLDEDRIIADIDTLRAVMAREPAHV